MGFKTEPLSLQIRNRDLSLLCGLFESRIMTAGHIATLYFDGKREAAKKRLQKLKTAGLIGEPKRKPYEPAVLFLTPLASKLLHREGKLAQYSHLELPAIERRSSVRGGRRTGRRARLGFYFHRQAAGLAP